jgi:hypothetical protein
MSGKVFVCLRKLWDREDFVICQGKIFWLPPPARQKIWGEILISDGQAN